MHKRSLWKAPDWLGWFCRQASRQKHPFLLVLPALRRVPMGERARYVLISAAPYARAISLHL